MSDTIRETINGIDHEFEVTFDKAYWDANVKISEDGMRAAVSYLSPDVDPINPQEEFDQVGKMICFHSRYTLGDQHDFNSPEEFLISLAEEFDPGFEDFLDWLENGYWSSLSPALSYLEKGDMVIEKRQKRIDKILAEHYIILPLYLYDHSGITMSTGKFSCPWDSGQVGWIYVTKKQAVEEWGKKICTKKVIEKAEKYLEGEVEEYDQYLTGDVYGVCLQFFVNEGTPDEPEWVEYESSDLHRDECWGFFGDEYAKKEAETWIDMPYVTRFLETPLPDHEREEECLGGDEEETQSY